MAICRSINVLAYQLPIASLHSVRYFIDILNDVNAYPDEISFSAKKKKIETVIIANKNFEFWFEP